MPDDPKISDETLLTEAQKGRFLSYLYKVAWPVRHVVPQMAYGVSYLTAIRKGKHSQEHVRKLNVVIQTVKDLQQEGLAQVVLRPIDLDKIMVVTHFDASFAKEPGHAGQSGGADRWPEGLRLAGGSAGPMQGRGWTDAGADYNALSQAPVRQPCPRVPGRSSAVVSIRG